MTTKKYFNFISENVAWVLIALIPLIYCIVILNNFMDFKRFTLEERAENAYKAGHYMRSSKFVEELLETDFQNIKLHRFRIRALVRSGDIDEKYIKEYETLSEQKDVFESNLGNYGLGIFHILENEYEKGLSYYFLVTDDEFPYLNNSIGFAYQELENHELAEQYFQRAIAIDDNASSAYSNLARIYLASGQQKKLAGLIEDESTAEFIFPSVKRQYYFTSSQYGLYAIELIKRRQFDAITLTGALLALGVWLVYLIKIDVFEREKPQHIVFALILGGIFMMCAIPIYDFYSNVLGFDLNGEGINDFLYCIFAIGAIEETVKIIPFLILLRFKSIVNETTDYIVYASLCALSFAFLENLLYFYPSGIQAIVPRLVTANVLHMAFTSFIAFGLLYAKLQNKSPYLYFTIGFCFSITIHGVYDFFLITEGPLKELSMISLGLAIYTIMVYALIINNALNHSEFNDGAEVTVRSAKFLLVSISLVAAYQYFVIGLSYGPENANISIGLLLIIAPIFGYIHMISLGHIQVVKGKWTKNLRGGD